MNLRQSLDVIKKYWNNIPVPVNAIALDLGIPVILENLPANISGAIQRDGAGYKIVVNENHAITRQRFTISHEIGHFIYHRDLLGAGTGDTRAYRAEGTAFPNPAITSVQETQANTFAANLLMPNHLIKELRTRGLTSPKQMASALMVSEEAMRIRLGLSRYPAFQADEEPQDLGEPHF